MTPEEIARSLSQIDMAQLTAIQNNALFNPNPRRSKYNKLWWHNDDFTKVNYKQYAMLCYQGKEALFGGRPFGGKSMYALMRAISYMDIPGYSALILRRTWPQLSKPGGLIPLSHEWLQPFTESGGMVWNENKRLWLSKEGGRLQFGHVENENDKYNFQGDSYNLLIFDEVTQFSFSIYEFISTRLRRSSTLADIDLPLQIQCTANPGGEGNDWVRDKFIENANENCIFVQSSMEDNLFGDHETYRKQIESITDVVLREQLLRGNWYILADGDFFKREWFDKTFVDNLAVPSGLSYVRAWDTAAMRKERKKESDYTVGVLMGKGKDGRLYILDMQRFQATMGTVDAIQRSTAMDDFNKYGMVRIVEEQMPGAGKNEIERKRTGIFAGFWYEGVPSTHATGGKVERAKGFASACQAGTVHIVRSLKGLNDLLGELSAFPTGPHDDICDAASLAFNTLTRRSEKRLIHSELHLMT